MGQDGGWRWPGNKAEFESDFRFIHNYFLTMPKFVGKFAGLTIDVYLYPLSGIFHVIENRAFGLLP